LLCVALLTASFASIIAAGLTDADRGPLESGRSSEGWKYWYNAIALSLLPRVGITRSKFDVLKYCMLKYCSFIFVLPGFM